MFPPIGQLHHAIIVTGNRANNQTRVFDYLSSQGIERAGNPDVLVFDAEQILMAQAEEIVHAVSVRKVGDYRCCIISCDRMAADVQNRLLKTFEEPEAGTHFFILIPTIDRMIPTILSRVQVIVGDQAEAKARLDAAEFLKLSMSERFDLVESFTKAKKDEDNASKAEVIAFFNALEKTLWEKGVREESVFADLRQARDYASIRGASHRVLLDFAGIVCPVLKK